MKTIPSLPRVISPKKGQAGISLVETMASGVVASVLAAAVVTLFSMQSHELDQGIGNAFLHGISNVVSEQIGQDIRKANRLLVPGEPWQSEGSFSAINTQTLLIYSNNGALLKAYRINSGTLEESVNLQDWVSFSVGSTIAKVDPSGYFQLSHDRKEAVLVWKDVLVRKNRQYRL
jgi:hypothetical protein